MTQTRSVPIEEAPFRFFHFHVAFSACGGEVADGFELGIIGIALSMAAGPLHLSALWMGILGAAAMVGLFIGSILTGSLVDRYGRYYIYGYNMLFMAIISGCQFFATNAWELLILRLLLGTVLGTDWVVAKAVVVEFTPTKYRGKVGSSLALTWTFGYAFSYVVGFLLRNTGPEAWHYMLAVSSIPAACIFLFRFGIPESPLWLMKQGRTEEARSIVLRKLGPNFSLPAGVSKLAKVGGEWAELFSRKWIKASVTCALYYVSLIAPLYAMATYLPINMKALHVTNPLSAGLYYNLFLMIGAVIGLFLVDKMSRRLFLLGTCYAGAVFTSLLVFHFLSSTGVIIVSGLTALVCMMANNLPTIYLPELFPTALRGRGIALGVASGRFAGTASTFLMPLVIRHYGISVGMGLCVAVLLVCGIGCHLWAPETRNVRLSAIGEGDADAYATRHA
ncbi:MAG: MFS transporter [Holophaga sp.]|nr:MFS transporter [Holophaga sp.]